MFALADIPSVIRPAPLTINQEFAFDAIDATVEKLVPLLASGRHHDLAHLVEVAQLLTDGYAPLATRRGGQPTIPLAEFCEVLEGQLSVEPFFLARCLRLLDVYGPEVIERFAGIPQISLSHLFVLIRLADDEVREEFEQSIIRERWAVYQLEREIRRRFGRQRAKGGGRKPAVPRNVKAALSNITAVAKVFASRSDTVWFGQLFNAEKAVAETAPDNLDRAFLDQLQETKAACQGVKEAAERNLAALDKMEARAADCMASHQSRLESAEA